MAGPRAQAADINEVGAGQTTSITAEQLTDALAGARARGLVVHEEKDAVISGGMFGVSAGLCVVSAGVFCVVAGAILTAAGLALAANNNQKCSGGKSLRVYPFSGHKPRCA